MTDFKKVDGKYVYKIFSPEYEDGMIFARKLLSEGVLDPEAFSHTDAIRKEKLVTGRAAMIDMAYDRLTEVLSTTLYKDHPEMKYIPVGPILNKDGKNIQAEGLITDGRGPACCIIMTKSCKDPAAAVRYINYIDSPEGQKLALFGVEGTHYTMKDGIPVENPEWVAKYKQDPHLIWNEGIRSFYQMFISNDCRTSALGGGYNYGDGGPSTNSEYWQYRKIYDMPVVKGVRVTYLAQNYPKYNDIMSAIAALQPFETTYFLKTDEEAKAAIQKMKDQLTKLGYEDFMKFINDAASGRNDVIN